MNTTPLCIARHNEGDNTAEVFGNLTLSFDTGEGVRSVFLMSLAKPYAVTMDCADKTALASERFQHVDLLITVPPGTRSAGGFWFVNDLMEADDGSFIDPDDNLGGYATMQYPLNAATPAKTWQIDFSEANAGDGTRLKILLDVTPIVE